MAELGYGCQDLPVFGVVRVFADTVGGEPRLGPLLAVIEAILQADWAAPSKQQHTA